MKKLRILIVMMLALCFAVSAFTQNNKEDDEGIPDDPNHVDTVLAARAMLRADRDMNKVYGMLMEIFNKSGSAKKRIEAAQKAWIAYRDLEVLAEVSDPGQYGGGNPEQTQRSLIKAELTRERIATMKRMIEDKYDWQKWNEPSTTHTLRVKSMLDRIDKMESMKPRGQKSIAK
ncbi:DUF1311 domain-containing protein [bacterium]|nr:DUF1311 domain-containing protein [bacterium]